MRKAARAALCRLLPRSPFGDGLFTIVLHFQRFGRLLRWRRPLTFNDHLLKLKFDGELYDPLRQFATDKYLLKDHVTQVAGPGYTLETLDLLTCAADIEAYSPRGWPCVLKPTHMSGRRMLLRREGEQPDRDLLKQWMGLNYYEESREANYRYLRPRIMVEPYYVGAEGVSQEYNVHCFDGRPKLVRVIRDRFGRAARYVYSPDWVKLPFDMIHGSEGSLPRPAFLEEILEVAERLAAPFSYVRVDFLVADGRPKVCELTHLSNNAMTIFVPPAYDRLLGRLFSEPESRIEDILGLPAPDDAPAAVGAIAAIGGNVGRRFDYAR